jgi:uncharacterized protein YuzE
MKIHFDKSADALYLHLNEAPIVSSEEVRPGVILDFDRNNQVIGMEILNVGTRIPVETLRDVKVHVT